MLFKVSEMSFSPRFTHGFSGETKEKAKLELNEDPVTRQTKIQLLRDKMVFRPDLPFRKTDKKMFYAFFRYESSTKSEYFNCYVLI